VCDELTAAYQRIAVLESAIKSHRDQKADDRCIEDDDRLYEALGDGIKCDRHVGDQEAMLRNCYRFVCNRTQGGKWPSYVELELKIVALEQKVELASVELPAAAPVPAAKPFCYGEILEALQSLGVSSANKEGQVARWSVTDLVTDLHPLLVAATKPCHRCIGHVQHIESLEREREQLREEIQFRSQKSTGQYWAWQGDETDHLESLTCPVLIRASDLRELLKPAEPVPVLSWEPAALVCERFASECHAGHQFAKGLCELAAAEIRKLPVPGWKQNFTEVFIAVDGNKNALVESTASTVALCEDAVCNLQETDWESCIENGWEIVHCTVAWDDPPATEPVDLVAKLRGG
jgi:hypothetical protein